MINAMKNNLLSSVFVLGMILLYSIPAKSQDLDALLEKEAQPQTTYATATFKSTRIVNGHSVQQMKKKQLEFRVSHRFGAVSYTHLRAHETRHDLVCRLLLEKK